MHCSECDLTYICESEDLLSEIVPPDCRIEKDDTEVEREVKPHRKVVNELITESKDTKESIQVPSQSLTSWINEAVEEFFTSNPGPRYEMNTFTRSN